jgi:hypothetical protein
MSQKRQQKLLKRRKNKAKGEAHFKMRQFHRFAQNMLAQMQQENKEEEKASEPS